MGRFFIRVKQPDRSYKNPSFATTNAYRYGFNGKELDKSGEFGSLTHYDYGLRIYNPSIGKFLSVDPITDEYPELTPYQFASNRPIQGVDLDGLEFFIPTTLLSTSPVISATSATTLMSSTNALRALPRTLYENGSKIEPILYEPIKSPAGIPRYNPNLSRLTNGSEMSKVGRIGHTAVENSAEFANLFQKINRFMTRSARPDGWSIDHINKIVRIGEIKSATKTGLRNGLRQLARYAKEAQKEFGSDYTIETHLFRYNSLVPVTYIVEPGDNAWDIAQNFETNIDEIKKLNPNIDDLNKLKVGQEIILDKVPFNTNEDSCETECSDN